MFDVLEHFESPDEMLKKAYDMLNPGGHLYVQVPNVLGAKLPYGHGLGLPYHLWQFDPQSLKRLLSKRYEVLAHWTGVQGVIGEYEKGGPSLYKRIIWQLAKVTGRGNRLQMIAKRSEASQNSHV